MLSFLFLISDIASMSSGNNFDAAEKKRSILSFHMFDPSQMILKPMPVAFVTEFLFEVGLRAIPGSVTADLSTNTNFTAETDKITEVKDSIQSETTTTKPKKTAWRRLTNFFRKRKVAVSEFWQKRILRKSSRKSS